ncbi:GlcG/HbpS family heme-binding protein [Crassaminicella profunda]|uniref:GlcG/HbpS family heme-binding protein n=1 Tax=Crassaminicella profunda TaxID=1286698 RepID=UPI001CA7A51D|nr:heme-binding protein [Crassaminicella profunda]QZY56058.1 heme-binding protein [Crassaminicella profunda]
MKCIKKLNISLEDSIILAKEAIKIATEKGFKICATVVDSSGVQIVSLRDDLANQITPESSFKKAYTAVAIKNPTLMMVNGMEKNPTLAQFSEINNNTIVYGGGVPIISENEVVGAIGIAGAPGGDKDNNIAEEAIAKILY